MLVESFEILMFPELAHNPLACLADEPKGTATPLIAGGEGFRDFDLGRFQKSTTNQVINFHSQKYLIKSNMLLT